MCEHNLCMHKAQCWAVLGVQKWVSSGLMGRREDKMCAGAAGGVRVKGMSRKQSSIHSCERLFCLHFSKRWGQHCQGAFLKGRCCVWHPWPGQESKAGGERKANRVDLCSQLRGQVWVRRVNQSLLLEISISSRRLKPNIHPALHENEQGRNNCGHYNVQVGAVGIAVERCQGRA